MTVISENQSNEHLQNNANPKSAKKSAVESTSFDFGLNPMPGEELHETLKRLKSEYGPVHEVRFLDMPAWIINDYDLLKSHFRNEEDFPPADIYRMFLEPVIGRTFQTMEGEEHRLYRQLATPSFKPSVLKHFDSQYLLDLGNELLDRFIDKGETDLTKAFTHLFPFIVISRLLGIPRDNEQQFHHWALAILSFASHADEAKRCCDEMIHYLKPIIKERRSNPGDDIISALTQIDVDGKKLSDEELLSTIHLMFSAGATTTHDAMGNLLYGVLTNNYWKSLVEDRSLIENAVEETLRWETPVALLPRTASATHDITIEGTTIPAGSILLFALCGANRDPKYYEKPDTFQLGTNDYSNTISFGQGYRMCPGLHLAKLQLRTMLSVLLDRLPNLTLVNPNEAMPQGAIIRGPKEMKVRF